MISIFEKAGSDPRAEWDKLKFEKIYLLYNRKMFAIALGILHNHHIAEEVVHEAFMRIAKNMDKIAAPEDESTKHYVLAIAKNCALTTYRLKQNSFEVGFSEAISYDRADAILEYEKTHINKELFDIAIDKAKTLKHDYKTVLFLYYVDELTCKEISELLSVSEPTVRKKLQRARDALIKKLRKEVELDEFK